MLSRTKDLPPVVKRTLKAMEFTRPDIAINAVAKVNPFNPGAEGSRGVFGILNLATEEFAFQHGDFNGPNPWNRGPTNPIDHDLGEVAALPGYLYFCGVQSGHGTYLTIKASTDTIAPMLPAPMEALEAREAAALRCCRFLSNGRAEDFDRAGLGTYGPTNYLVQALVRKGMLKVSASGAISVTFTGKQMLATI